MGEMSRVGAAAAASLQDKRNALIAAVAGLKNPGTGERRGQPPLLVEYRAETPILVRLVPRVDLEDRNGVRQDERQRAFIVLFVAKREYDPVLLPRGAENIRLELGFLIPLMSSRSLSSVKSLASPAKRISPITLCR